MNPKLDFLTSRRSVRRFTNEKISKDTIQNILEATIHAPNAHNRQAWRFVALDTLESKTKIGLAMGKGFEAALRNEGLSEAIIIKKVTKSRERIENAPGAILFCLDTSVLDQYDDPVRNRGEIAIGVQSVAMGGCYAMLAAHTLGLGSVWVCAPLFSPESVQTALELPGDWLPQGMLLLGHPQTSPKPRPRKHIHEVMVIR